MEHGTEGNAAWVEFSKQDNGQQDEREPNFARYESTGATYKTRITLRENEDFVRVRYTVTYPRYIGETAVWVCETWTPGTPKFENTATTASARMVGPKDLTVRDVDRWSSAFQHLRNQVPGANFSEIEYIHRWNGKGIAYVDTPWLGLIDRGSAIVSWSPDAQALKLWSWGSDVFHQDFTKSEQPYFEPWRSPLNKDFLSGNSVQSGQKLEWDEIFFPMVDVDDGDLDGFRERVQMKIAAAN
jgi:hypothetical protein